MKNTKKCTTPNCTVTTSPIGTWFLLAPLGVEIPRYLPRRGHIKFSFDRRFAGLCRSGTPLSVEGSAGPAAIGAIPLVPEKPKGWLTLPHLADAGLLVLTASPRLVFVGIRKAGYYEACTSLCIHPEDLASIVEIPDQESQPSCTDVKVESLTAAHVNLLIQHSPQIKIALLGKYTYLRISASLQLPTTVWTAINRHVFTGKCSGTVLDTTEITNYDFFRLQLPGHSIDEVEASWGACGSRPSSYDGTHLAFTSLEVVDGAKLSRLYPKARGLKGRRLEVLQFYPRDASPHYGMDLAEAEAAQVIPKSGVLHVDESLSTIYAITEELHVEDFKQPVEAPRVWRQDPAIVCPHHLIEKFLMPARQAVRIYAVPRTLRPFRVRTRSVTHPSDGDPPGNYYLLSDLRKLATYEGA